MIFHARKKLQLQRLKELAAARTADQLLNLSAAKQLAAEGLIPTALVQDLTLACLDTWTQRLTEQKQINCLLLIWKCRHFFTGIPDGSFTPAVWQFTLIGKQEPDLKMLNLWLGKTNFNLFLDLINDHAAQAGHLLLSRRGEIQNAGWHFPNFYQCYFFRIFILLEIISFPAVCKIERRIATEDPEGEVTGSCPWHCNHEKARIVSR